MKPAPGTYALIFRCSRQNRVKVGRLGSFKLQQGYYIYIGSAFGPGGILARTKRHRKISKRRHWHIDYLRPHVELTEIWHSHDPIHREHQWADFFLKDYDSALPLDGFGSSDCTCRSHLFYYRNPLVFLAFTETIKKTYPEHAPIGISSIKANKG